MVDRNHYARLRYFLLLTAIPCLALAEEAAVRQQLHQSRTKYATADAWAQRRSELRTEFLKGARLWPLPDRPPVKAIVHSRREYGDYSVENVALETLPGFYCTGNLYRPLGRKDLGPAILCPHGHFQPLGRMREEQQIRCAHFARMGATVFSYSMVGWQDSQQTTHDDPLVLALQTWNSIRAVDYLTSLERVDPNRVGVTGASGGGTQSFYLALVDERVKASAPLVIVYTWSAPEGCKCEGGMPVMEAAKTNAIELAAATSPRAQLLISVGNDPTENFPQNGFPFIEHMYGVAGAADKVASVHLADEGHDFGPSKRKLVYEFFAKHLAMQPDRFVAPDKPEGRLALSEDLTKIKIEPPEQMEVFSAAHPLPDHAIKGSNAIAAAFDQHLEELRATSSATASAIPITSAPPAEYSVKPTTAADEAFLFTPPGFEAVGLPKVASGTETGTLEIAITDSATNQPTHCRVNVVGADGAYYEPAKSNLKQYSLTGVWPKSGWGNRQEKAPIRYLGRFFYTDGSDSITVPTGVVRVEFWKGFEYRPETVTATVAPGATRRIEIELTKTASMAEHGYWSGDPHLHIDRRDEADESRIFDLLAAEDIHYGTTLAYNEPAGPYTGAMNAMDSPQFRGLGKRSIVERDGYALLSGQEYRSGPYGHMNLFLLDELVAPGASYDANNWPPFGHVAAAAREAGGIALYAHGGYAQEIYADVVQDNIDGVELLQFGVYRGIGLDGWYDMLNAGFRVPAVGACDYPACRKLGDCITYVWSDERPGMEAWLRGMARGESFVTSGPLLLLEVDGGRPGSKIAKSGQRPHIVDAKVRVRCEVAPVTHVQLIANGRVIREVQVPASAGKGGWIELEQAIEVDASAWIAARAYSLSPLGTPDAESHTNPVYVYLDGRAPYDQNSLDSLVAAIDGQIAIHKGRKFPEQAQVIAYFEHSRDILMKIREAGGAASTGHPSDIARATGAIDNLAARTHSDEELKAFLKPVPPKSPSEALETFETIPGFQLELLAAEPLVFDPISAAIDEDGNLYVTQMRDYPYHPKPRQKPLGSVRMLRDTDGDGRYDEGHLFADELLWAGGVACWKGGVFVAAPPDIWYFKDTDGDHQADVRRKVFTGFGEKNQQAMVNNLKWGLDHKIYGSTAGNGGDIRPADKPEAQPVSVNGRDFRFDPVSETFESITGTIQFGNTFDDWGNRFLCSESTPLHHVVLEQKYLERNPYVAAPAGTHNIAGGAVPIFRISPIERWRQIRSSRRIAHGERDPNSAGASHHVIDAAAGVTVYTGSAYPAEFYGNVFVGDAQNNLVHRRRLTARGITFDSTRADEGAEFVRSSDNWFRPVNFVNAPDGTLYVLDMSREILEAIHIPLDVMQHLDLKSGRTTGRIYRMAPTGFRAPPAPRLSQATTEELVALLAHPNGWHRETARRLLLERQDKSAVEPLRRMLLESTSDVARLGALYSLAGLKAVSTDDLKTALDDRHPGVREHALRLAESRIELAPELLERVIILSRDAEMRVRFQAAFSLGETRDPRAIRALAELAVRDGADAWMSAAILSSAGKSAEELLIALLPNRDWIGSGAGREMSGRLAFVVGARNQEPAIAQLLDAVAEYAHLRDDAELQSRIVQGLADGLSQANGGLTVNPQPKRPGDRLLSDLLELSLAHSRDTSLAEATRVRAIRLLGVFPYEATSDALFAVFTPANSEPVQSAAVGVLGGYNNPQIADRLLENWRQATPTLRIEVVRVLLSRQPWALRYLSAVESNAELASILDPAQREQLIGHKSPEVRELAKKLLGSETLGPRRAVIDEYESCLTLPANSAVGERVFERACAACHQINGKGHAIGPNLASSSNREPEALLTHILDPSQYVLPQFVQYTAVDKDGRIYQGMLAAQTSASVTLVRDKNASDTLLRSNLEALVSTGKSLMPEGLEQQLTKQDLADLIAWLHTLQAGQPTTSPMLDIGSEPGIIEP